MTTIAQALVTARHRIPVSEARLLLAEATQQSATWLLTHDDAVLGNAALTRFNDWVARRSAGEPVAYLLGRREFYGRDFHVAPGVLIPRPETELLVDAARAKVSRCDTASVLDLGTGSGCIALSIALECPTASVTAVDCSAEALKIAERNRVQLKVGNARLLHSHWFAALSNRRFDLIVSNPPYIAAADPHLEQGDLRAEPRSALASGRDGLDDLRHIIAHAPSHLNADGELWLEHGYDQSAPVRHLLAEAGFSDITSRKDIAGIERISGGRLPA